MADPKIEIAIWAGIPLVVLLVFSFALDKGAQIQKDNRVLKGLAKQYDTYYLDKQATQDFPDALAHAQRDLVAQDGEYKVISERLIPPLPAIYTTSNYTQASARATEDLEAVRKLAERSGVPMPGSVPNADALSVDPNVFSQQMAQLYLFRQASQLLIKDAASGKLSILNVKLGDNFTDSAGGIAVLQLDYSLQIDFRSLERVLRTFNNDKLGLAIRSFEVHVPDQNQVVASVPYMDVSMSISLMLINQEAWGLKVLDDATTPASPATNSGARRGRGGRF